MLVLSQKYQLVDVCGRETLSKHFFYLVRVRTTPTRTHDFVDHLSCGDLLFRSIQTSLLCLLVARRRGATDCYTQQSSALLYT